MYKSKTKDGRNNICGKKIGVLRENMPDTTSQRKLAELLCKEGLTIDKNAIQRIECGKRFVTDIELKALAKVLGVRYEELLDD